jgi:CRP-like cAMP-binding protein
VTNNRAVGSRTIVTSPNNTHTHSHHSHHTHSQSHGIKYYGPGYMIGEIAMITNSPYFSTVVVAGNKYYKIQ